MPKFQKITPIKHKSVSKWKIFIDNPFLNCDRVYPIQQKKVKAFIDSILDDKNVIKIVVFGSSVTDRCNIDSDVDLYVELLEDKKVKLRYLDFPFDLWTNFTVDKRMKEEIKKKGVIVYERNIVG